ncbi:MAG: chemotaxis protein CheR [Deltaproteobacteria bacterium]|nr:chemotaxis protein CheR [Deltaproteobacteria bacterium]
MSNGYEDLMQRPKMTEKDFGRLSEFIQKELGIKMPEAKKAMLESRLQKRLRALGFGSYAEYCDYLFGPDGLTGELVYMIDLVTTNKTEFFRESAQFEYLFNTALPELVKTTGAGVKRELKVWSAGCSTGEEPYTLSMVLMDFAERYPGLGFKYLVIATDISTRVLELARMGIYSAEKAESVRMDMRKKYLLKSKDSSKELVRIMPELRARVRFRRLNLMEDDFGFREPIDIIFCRNVIIYFNRETQQRLLAKFCDCIDAGNYIFVGHSETLNDFYLPLEKVAPSIYRKIA